jgi:hypothetical protein
MYTLELDFIQLIPRHLEIFGVHNTKYLIQPALNNNGYIDIVLTGTKENLLTVIGLTHNEDKAYFELFAKPYTLYIGEKVITEDSFKIPYEVTVDITNEPDDIVDHHTFVDTQGECWRVDKIIKII